MRCISVYTGDFSQFSDIYDQVLQLPMGADEELTVEGVTVIESGDVPQHYIQRMRKKQGVVVLTESKRDIIILQHGDMFEILLPDAYLEVHLKKPEE